MRDGIYFPFTNCSGCSIAGFQLVPAAVQGVFPAGPAEDSLHAGGQGDLRLEGPAFQLVTDRRTAVRLPADEKPAIARVRTVIVSVCFIISDLWFFVAIPAMTKVFRSVSNPFALFFE